MKAVTAVSPRSIEFGLKQDLCKVVKNKYEEPSGEMQACFHKLKELVPSIQNQKKISKTQLLQHVIDYICDLEVALEFHPVLYSSQTSRAPLSEKSEPNMIVCNEVQEAMDEDAAESDCESRPPSK